MKQQDNLEGAKKELLEALKIDPNSAGRRDQFPALCQHEHQRIESQPRLFFYGQDEYRPTSKLTLNHRLTLGTCET